MKKSGTHSLTDQDLEILQVVLLGLPGLVKTFCHQVTTRENREKTAKNLKKIQALKSRIAVIRAKSNLHKLSGAACRTSALLEELLEQATYHLAPFKPALRVWNNLSTS